MRARFANQTIQFGFWRRVDPDERRSRVIQTHGIGHKGRYFAAPDQPHAGWTVLGLELRIFGIECLVKVVIGNPQIKRFRAIFYPDAGDGDAT
ncbi:MAG TPA: hypothetical protein VN034_11365 [Sphingopyxis sp.]|nr:hypothetical protein [Sphingopyxis sp.]